MSEAQTRPRISERGRGTLSYPRHHKAYIGAVLAWLNEHLERDISKVGILEPRHSSTPAVRTSSRPTVKVNGRTKRRSESPSAVTASNLY